MKGLILGILLLLTTNTFAQGCFADKNGKESFKVGLHIGASDQLLKLPKGTTYSVLCNNLNAKKFISGRPVDGGNKYSFDIINKDDKTIRVVLIVNGDRLNFEWKELD